MSWGFFLDLNLTLPTTEWKRIAKTKTRDHGIEARLWGFKDEAYLGEMFSRNNFENTKIGDAVKSFDRDDSQGTVDSDGDVTRLRLVQLLDRGGEPDIAKAIAALVEASKATATGTLRLVNDGSYGGEDGVEIQVARGKLSRKRIKDAQRRSMELGTELFGEQAVPDGDMVQQVLALFGVAPAKPKAKAKAKPTKKTKKPKKK